jgi:cAMP-dependent protein kinase regulator
MRFFRSRPEVDVAGLSLADADALKAATAAVAAHPHDLTRRRQLADLCVRLGRRADALAHYQAIAGAFAAQGLLFRAIGVCKTILELDPTHTETATTLASLYARHEAERPSLPPAMAGALIGEADVVDADDVVDDVDAVEADVVDADTLAAVTVLPGGSVTLARPEAVPLFSGLSPARFTELLTALRAWEADAGAVVVAEGEPGDSVFVVASGAVAVERAGSAGPVPMARLGPGTFFGEIALIARRPRAATVTALERTQLLEIDAGTLATLCARDPSVTAVLKAFCDDRLVESTVRTSPLFSALDDVDRRRVIRAMTPENVRDGAVLIEQGAPTPGLQVVLSGAVDVVVGTGIGSVRLKQLQAGDVFGEMGLITGRPASARCVAVGATRLARLAAPAFGELQAALPTLADRLHELSAAREAFNARFLPDDGDARPGTL